MLTQKEQFELLKKHYILETSLLLQTLEELQMEDMKQAGTKARIALLQAGSATSFLKFCRYTLSLNSADTGNFFED